MRNTGAEKQLRTTCRVRVSVGVRVRCRVS